MKKGTCKHFNGSINTHCDAEVCYRDVTNKPDEPGSAFRKPCHSLAVIGDHDLKVIEDHGPQGVCDKYEEPTEAEIAEYEAEVEAYQQRFMLTLPLISQVKKEHCGEDWKGVETCPVCDGNLHMTHAALNGHVWGRCETEGCLAWME